MIIRGLTVSFLFAVLALPAYAQDSSPQTTSESTPQDNPQTRQTDEAEDDYRRSQRRRDTGDIFEDIGINPNSGGSGSRIFGREVKAIDRLDQESRRHLNKQRAKAMAEAQPGEPIDAAYEPSDVAKSDEYVAKQEQRAWDEMMREANSGLAGTQGQGTGSGGGHGSGQGGQQGQGQAGGGQQGQSSQGQSGQGQSGGGQSGQSSQAGQPSTSPLRGGSASSASSILDQIRGRSGSGGGTAPRAGQTAGGGQAPTGQAPQGQSPQFGQGNSSAQGQDQNPAAGQAQNDAQAQSDTQSDAKAAADAKATADSTAQAQAQSDAQAAAEANDPNAAAEAAAHRETMSPLERLKRDPVERETTGGRTSASDYLNRKKD